MQALRKRTSSSLQYCSAKSSRCVVLAAACAVLLLASVSYVTTMNRPRPPPLQPLRRVCVSPSVDALLKEDHNIRQRQRAAAAMSVSSTTSQLQFHDWVDSLLFRHFGKAIAEAVYDPEIFNAASRELSRNKAPPNPHESATTMLSHPDDGFFFTIKGSSYPVAPKNFHNISNMLWWCKRMTSIAIARISRDSELDKLYRRVTAVDANPLKWALLEATVVRAISAQVQYFHTVLQLAVDIALTSEVKTLLRTFFASSSHRTSSSDHDALVLVSGWMTVDTPIEDVDALFRCRNLLTEVLRHRAHEMAYHDEQLLQKGIGFAAGASQGLYPIYYDDVAFDESFPPHGKFWNMVRPTAGCSSIIRACEIPDGCRMLCNAEYLVRAGLSPARTTSQDRQPSASTPPYRHRIIGMGSNNQFDWELSLLRVFNATSAAFHGHSHHIGWMTSMDCTITVEGGPRHWNVPEGLRSAHVGHNGVSMCADGARRESNILSPNELKDFQLQVEQRYDHTAAALAHDWPVVRSTVADSVLRNPLRGSGREHHVFTMPAVTGAAVTESPRWFDALSIYKMDIERFEWNVVPAWLYGELRSIGKFATTAVAKGASVSIDFELAAPDFFSVSLFSLEIHRIGQKYKEGDVDGALRMHWFMLHMYGLGFVMVGHEKNEIDQCCFEHTYAHVRHFVRSEMWMALREEL
jgi:hypothetical protein